MMRAVKLALFIGCSASVFSALEVHATETRLDTRLGHTAIDNRISAPRLELKPLVDEEEKDAIVVTKKKTTGSAAAERVSKARLRRSTKTKRVVAGQ